MTITDPILYMTPEERRSEHQRRLDKSRKWLNEEPPLPTAEVVGPIIAALLSLHDLRERFEAHVDALDAYEFTNVTNDDWRAARELLALQHEIADLLSLEVSGWAVEGKRLRLGAAIRAVLYEAMNTEELVRVPACADRRIQNEPLNPVTPTAPVSASVGAGAAASQPATGAARRGVVGALGNELVHPSAWRSVPYGRAARA